MTGSRGAALPLLGSVASLQAQQAVGVPAAALHGDIDKLLDECRRAMLEAGLQQPDQDLFVQPKEAQHGQDEVLQHDGRRGLLRKDQPQLLLQPGQKASEQSWVVVEKGRPGVGLEATHWSPGH